MQAPAPGDVGADDEYARVGFVLRDEARPEPPGHSSPDGLEGNNEQETTT